MSVVVMLVGLATGEPSPYDGQYLTSYDPSRPGQDASGRPMLCILETCDAERHARRFPSVTEAHEYVYRVSESSPVRLDGKPNRPLSAYTIMMVKVPPL